jgi:hypothetical protein
MHPISYLYNPIRLEKTKLYAKSADFDFDGLVFDTEMPECKALNKVYVKYGESLPFEILGLLSFPIRSRVT